MKVLHITDSHGTVKSPQGRKDIYYVAFLRKLYELGYVIRKENIKAVIHTGDLFHTPNVSDKFTGQVSEIIKSWGIPVYVVPGNHDIVGYTIDTIDQTKLGLLRKAGVVLPLDRSNPLRWNIKTPSGALIVAVSGQEYYADIDTGNEEDFEMQQPEADINILCIHSYIADKPQHPNIKHTLVKDILTDADIILSGHYHNSFHVDMPDFSVYNPGSMMRVEQNEYNKTHMPQYGILELSVDEAGDPYYDYTFHQFKTAMPSTEIFDYSAQAAQKAKILGLMEFNQLIEQSAKKNVDMSLGFKDILNNYQADDNVKLMATTFVSAAYSGRNTETDLNGYFVSGEIRIEKVVIDNFQSHKHTEVIFDKVGLNIIAGESNEGKTSILRAIMWVLTGKPSGAGFITTGEDRCEVAIHFTNGDIIKRSRTRKSAGKYKVIHANGNTNEYSGFGSTIPFNIHQISQMPPIDIEGKRIFANVMSQFDSAFFVSDSPGTRAKIIGKIAGVDAADSAMKLIKAQIKDTEKDIEGSKKDIDKNYAELAAMPDYKIISAITYTMGVIIKDICNPFRAQEIDRLTAIQTRLNEAQNTKLLCMNKIAAYGNILKISSVIEKANALLKEIKRYESIAERYGNKAAELSNTEDRISYLDNALKQNRITDIHKYTQSLLSELNVLQKYDKDISALKATELGITRTRSKCESTIKAITPFADMIRSVIDQYNRYTDYEKMYVKKIKALQMDADSIDITIYNCGVNIKNSEMDRDNLTSELLKANGKENLCPCCGQPVKTKTAKRNVMDYIGGKA